MYDFFYLPQADGNGTHHSLFSDAAVNTYSLAFTHLMSIFCAQCFGNNIVRNFHIISIRFCDQLLLCKILFHSLPPTLSMTQILIYRRIRKISSVNYRGIRQVIHRLKIYRFGFLIIQYAVCDQGKRSNNVKRF